MPGPNRGGSRSPRPEPHGPSPWVRHALALGLLLAAAGLGAGVLTVLLRRSDRPPCSEVATIVEDAGPLSQADVDRAAQALDEAKAAVNPATALAGAPREAAFREAERSFSTVVTFAEAIDFDLCEADYNLASLLRGSVDDIRRALAARDDPALLAAEMAKLKAALKEGITALGYRAP